MAHYQVILAYDGTGFTGSQRQAKSRTVQGELEKALRKLGWSQRSVLLAGRTDSGVHATGQVASFALNWKHADEDLLRALNAHLPADIAVRKVRIVSSEFHPRFDAIARSYQYRIYCQPTRDPLRENFAWRIWPLNKPAELHGIAEKFIGQHDFAAYGSSPNKGGSTVREVMNASWKIEGDELYFNVQANSFLYHMVRRLVFIQVAITQGKVIMDTLARSLSRQFEKTDASGLPPGIAPARGLSLIAVDYPDDKISSGQNE